MLAMYLAVLDDRSSEEQFIDVYNTYKRLVYHTKPPSQPITAIHMNLNIKTDMPTKVRSPEY